VRFDSYARYALIGALAISLACARNTEEEDTSATGAVTATDTGATVRVKPDTTAMDTVGKIPADTVRAPIDTMRPPMDSTIRPGTTDSARIGTGADTTSPGPGWPTDTTKGGWSTPPDSGR
jgi:hypothetical protein